MKVKPPLEALSVSKIKIGKNLVEKLCFAN